jgi:hypothetical protein
VLPALGPDGIKQGHSVRPQELCEYLLRDFPGGRGFVALDLLGPMRRATTRLEEAELIRAISLQRTPFWQLTALGESVLAEGTVEEHLAG